jgi:C-terminal processing protease CtpA/Prc
MTRRRLALAALLVLVPAWALLPAAAETLTRSGNAVFDRTVDLVNRHFFPPTALPQFNDAAALAAGQMPDLKDAAPGVVGDAVRFVLASLNASHTGRFTPDQVDYYELADVFRFALRGDIRRLFPPRGSVTYAGIGIASETIDCKSFAKHVYDGGPAARAGLMTGDEIVSVDGAPFAEIGSFRGKAGETAHLMVRRAPDAAPIAIDVPVETIEPGDLFVSAIADSVKRVDQGNRRIGYIRLWAYTRGETVTQILYDELGQGRLKDVDGLVLDLRSKWGGAPGDAAETFVGGAADMMTVDRDGTRSFATFRWPKPVVAIIDGGTRSGMEVLAYSLKKNGVPLVGAPTAGDVLAGTTYLLPDDSLLEMAVADVFIDGERLEAHPVLPDVAVPFDVRYAGGHDPQLDAATALMAERLGTGGDMN